MKPLQVRSKVRCVLFGVSLAVFGVATSLSAKDVENSEPPLHGEKTLKLEEVWRLDGDGELLLGVISDAVRGPDGNTYLLDSQLHEIQVISPDGEYLRTIGREGEGPGEFQRAWSLMVLPDGRVGVLQSRPGKIVLLEPTGEPAGDLAAPGPEGSTPTLIDAHVAGNQMFWRTSTSQRIDNGFQVRQVITRTRLDGTDPVEITATEFEREFSSEIREVTGNGFRRWAVTADGALFLQHGFHEYEFEVFPPGESPESSGSWRVRMNHRPHERTEAELEAARSKFFISGGVQIEYIVSPTDPATVRLDAREDGRLWVLTSDGAYRNPAGTVGVWDVFEADGRFVERVTLRGNGDYDSDGFEFLGTEHFLVVEEQSSATRASMGSGEDAEDEEVVPLSVVCYRIR